MVAIDEPSAIRQQAITGEAAPDWTSGLFEKVNEEDDYLGDLGDAANPQANTLIARLAPRAGGLRMNYRIYSADVPVRAAKWSNVD